MTVAGDIETPTLRVNPYDDTTVVTLHIEHPGTGALAEDTGVHIAGTDPEAGRDYAGTPLLYDVGGVWRQHWHVSSPGPPRTRTRTVYVGADTRPAPAGLRYATTADVVRETGITPDADTETLLVSASAEIDRLIVCAHYPVDADGYPADPAVGRVLMEATCELLRWWDETGDAAGASVGVTSSSIAGVSIGWGAGGAPRVGGRVMSVLRAAGLLGWAPDHG